MASNIATLINQITTDRNTIRTKLIELGIATSTADLNDCATAINGIVNRGSVSATVQEGATYSIPAGYHDGSGTVSGVSGGGNYSLQSKSVTPTKAQQAITPDSGYYGLSDVTVKAIPDNYQDVSSVDAVASNVLSGKKFVTPDGTLTAGTMANNGGVSKTLTVQSPSYTIPAGYHNGNGIVQITAVNSSVTPTKETQEVTADSNNVLYKVTVAPIPDQYQDISGVTATAENVLDGYSFVDSTGATVNGSIPVIKNNTFQIDALSDIYNEVTIESAYLKNSKVILSSTLEEALAAI